MKVEHWLLLILSFLLGTSFQIPRPQADNQQQNAQAERPNQQAISQPIPPSERAPDAAGRQQGSQDRSQFWNILDSVLTLVFTGALVVITFRQASLMGKQTTLMNKQVLAMNRQTDLINRQVLAMNQQTGHMEASLAETKKAADAAEESANTAQQALLVVERPYLFVARIRPYQIEQNKEPWVIVRFENSGRTIAQNVYVSVNLVFQRFPEDGSPLVFGPEVFQKPTQGPYSIPAGAGIEIPMARGEKNPLTDEETAHWRKYNLQFFVWGTITYDDTLGNPQQFHRYCARYIHWGIEPRHEDIPHFWILSDISAKGVAWK